MVSGCASGAGNVRPAQNVPKGYKELMDRKGLPRYYDRAPDRIVKSDLQLLDKLDRITYGIAERKSRDIDVAKIYDFIIKHKAHISEYDMLKVTTTLDIGSRTKNPYSNYYNYNPIESKQFYSAYIEFTYPIWDKKTEMRINNEILDYNLGILKKIEEYAAARQDYFDATEELEFLRVKQRVMKGEVLSGIKYREERFAILDKIRDAKVRARKARDHARVLQLYLLNLVTDPEGLLKLL
jgi:hypothetical protein